MILADTLLYDVIVCVYAGALGHTFPSVANAASTTTGMTTATTSADNTRRYRTRLTIRHIVDSTRRANVLATERNSPINQNHELYCFQLSIIIVPVAEW